MTVADLDIRQLRALRAVAEEGSFIDAAASLGRSQSAVSQQIASLERAIGQRVFDRPGGPRPVALTPAGHTMLRYAEEILSLIADAHLELADLAAGTGGRLTIGTFQSVSVKLLPELVRELRAQVPALNMTIVERVDNEHLLQLLVDEQIDMTFLEGPFDDPRLDLVELGVDPFIVLLPVGAPGVSLTSDGRFPVAALNGVPLIGEPGGNMQQQRIEARLRAAGVTPRYAFRSTDNGTLQGMVRAGLGPMVIGRLAADTSDPGVRALDLEPPLPPRTILLASRKGATLSPAAERFIAVARRECRRQLAQPADH